MPSGIGMNTFSTIRPWRGNAATRDHGVFIEHAAKLGARTRDPALHRADLAAADLRGVFVIEAAGANQDQRFTMMLGQLPEGAAEVAELEAGLLRRHLRR